MGLSFLAVRVGGESAAGVSWARLAAAAAGRRPARRRRPAGAHLRRGAAGCFVHGGRLLSEQKEWAGLSTSGRVLLQRGAAAFVSFKASFAWDSRAWKVLQRSGQSKSVRRTVRGERGEAGVFRACAGGGCALAVLSVGSLAGRAGAPGRPARLSGLRAAAPLLRAGSWGRGCRSRLAIAAQGSRPARGSSALLCEDGGGRPFSGWRSGLGGPRNAADRDGSTGAFGACGLVLSCPSALSIHPFIIFFKIQIMTKR